MKVQQNLAIIIAGLEMVADIIGFFLIPFLLLSFSTILSSKPHNIGSHANLSTSWTNVEFPLYSGIFSCGDPILLRKSSNGVQTGSLAFFCGDSECVLAVLLWKYGWNAAYRLVWSANRNSPVGINATLQLRPDGDLVLENPNGTIVWSSNTRGKSVSGLSLTEDQNLVLFGRNGETIWQSFDHPTDSLVLGQRLIAGQKVTARVSQSKYGSGMYSVSVDNNRLVAYVESNPPQIYYASGLGDGLSYAEFVNGSFGGLSIPPTTGSNDQYIRLGFDGLLKAYQFRNGSWTEGTDLFNEKLGVCGHPLVCGTYGICSNGYCHCPEDTTSASGQGSYFKQIDYGQPSRGCSMVTPLSCNQSRQHILLELKNTSYFTFHTSYMKMAQVKSVEDCKSMCLRNCSCKAALFVLHSTSKVKGRCLVLNEVFSIINAETLPGYDTTLFLKVQNIAVKFKREKNVVAVVASSIASFLLFLSVILFWLVQRRRRIEQESEFEVGFWERVVGMPTTYSYQELKATTDDFSHKLGEGGFGCVYEGVLKNGTKIAVKRLNLNGLGNLDDSFLAEVETIGSIHHANLVNLIGFCFQKSHRLLVYEHMANGSLDRWIFGNDQSHSLPWKIRSKIILDVAKGLAYLHEDCSQKIIHFDIKPQNILLDQNFNAKVADFGLSKLIDKDQSRIITLMRGTPGYLAPEWLSAIITEKVDVYSFGILILEIVCGRKNLDWSRDEEDRHLLELFKRKAEEGEIQNLVDEKIEDFQSHVDEAEELMKIAGMCLLSDFRKRPAMSLVVKVLKSLMASETDLEYDFIQRPLMFRAVETADHADWQEERVSLIMSSALSAPR